jgi:hypothetical protein
MCSRIQCEKCGKPSYRGCGMHVEQVLRDVPVTQRCRCHESARPARGTKPRKSWFDTWRK